MEQINIQTLISIICCAITVYGWYRTTRNDTKDSTKDFVELSVKLDTICSTIQDIKSDLRASNNQLNSMLVTQVEHTEKLKNHEHRLKELEG